MKINVEFDLTPAEFRESLGLPDVEAFQRDLMSRIQQQMEAGVEGYDPWSLMQPFMQQGLNQGLSQGFANFGSYQQMMLDMFRQAGSNAKVSTSSEKASSPSPSASDEKAREKAAEEKSGSASSSRSNAASSSRQGRARKTNG
ncbi:hypothetical protein SAMN02745148_02614 [Modicisalibacter ilicicola DSM 19980]|uniref:Uncharacterized protein n=1 Tax=Modicisalibacter ilicicola DSM 19980 TaxID=1121942 RepID=A0A1M5BK01_9GAMM|nr:hypothetical protein [Halomonas ilicicola]SHF42755.1 hypothetical protein SAMN02745148_02614 [Halomonas ilicicola DSM 19980]